MIRKLFLAALVAAGLVGGATLTTATASAYPPVGHDQDRHDRHHHVRFQVLIRHGHHWDAYRTFHDRDDARRAAWRLERQGHDAKITHVHDH